MASARLGRSGKPPWTLALVLPLGGLLGLGGCTHQKRVIEPGSVQTTSQRGQKAYQHASAGLVGCSPEQITISNLRGGGRSQNSWTASCGGRSFACSGVGRLGLACTPMDQGRPNEAQAASTGSPAGQGSNVQRGYQEKTGISYVRGEFRLPQNLDLRLTGAPSVQLGKIVVAVKGSNMATGGECKTMEVLINAKPTAADANRYEGTKWRFDLESDFDFQVFKPLAKQYPEFSVRMCGKTFALSSDQIADLRKFFVLYSELAQEEAPTASGSAAPVSETF